MTEPTPDAGHTPKEGASMEERTSQVNPRCPDHSSHTENAFDRLFPDRRTMNGLTEAEMDAIDAESADEYSQCEGH